MAVLSDAVVSTLRYANANSEALRTEKPYILNYPAPPGLPKSNFKIDFVSDIPVRNLRTAGLRWGDSGIRIAKLEKGCMPKKDFEDEDKIERDYLPVIHDCLKESLGAEEVCIFDYMVRRREAAFPYQAKSKDSSPQPALSAHIDYTTDEIAGRVTKYFKEKAATYASRHYQIVNVWKPLNGPLRDYPMAYCDAKSMDPKADLMAVDEVFPTVANEVYQVLYNPNHEWYYIPDQQVDEVAIFAGYDSRKGQAISVPHCSFDLGEASSGQPRESIEVRAFVFYGDKEIV